MNAKEATVSVFISHILFSGKRFPTVGAFAQLRPTRNRNVPALVDDLTVLEHICWMV